MQDFTEPSLAHLVPLALIWTVFVLNQPSDLFSALEDHHANASLQTLRAIAHQRMPSIHLSFDHGVRNVDESSNSCRHPAGVPCLNRYCLSM